MKKYFTCIMKALLVLCAGCCTDDAISQAQKLVQSDQASCVLVKNGKLVAQESGRGLGPLFVMLDKHGEEMAGGVIVDKVIGKAAAAIIVCGGAEKVCTGLISEPGLVLLEKHGIKVCFEQKVPQILNRRRDGLCPMEKRVAAIDDPEEAVKALRQK
ncbi:MAG: DUF1893 domain-containing protein [Lentisphaeria bacterium]|nr:DUF1893 domain-containing protein [Lentisphaeria bacterium]